MILSAKSKGVLLTAFILLTAATVRAATADAVRVDNMNVAAFPGVELDLNISGDVAGLLPGHLQILENGVETRGALVLLPPAPATTKIDLYILLDTAGLRENWPVIKRKLEALADYLEADQTDIKLYLSILGVTQVPKGFADMKDFRNQIASLDFGSGIPTKADGYHEISALADSSSAVRTGAQKVLLVINGTPFYKGNGDAEAEVVLGVGSAIERLEKNFITFVVGYPFKSLQAFGSVNTVGEQTLSRSAPGGYLGSFSTDLTRVIDLLKNRDINHFRLYYTSGLMLDEASGAGVDMLFVGGQQGHVSYPVISTAAPTVSYIAAPSVMQGESVPIRVEVDPMGKMVAEAVLRYQNIDSRFQDQILKFNRAASTPAALIYEGEISAGDYPKDGLNYAVNIYTPFDWIDSGADNQSVEVESVDNGIKLTPTANKNTAGKVISVTWTLSGPTVDMGSKYEIWAAGANPETDKPLLPESTDRKFTLPIIGDCDRYQLVKARVFVRPGELKKAGWSLFSRSFEYYYEEPGITQDSVTEEAGAKKLVTCITRSAYDSFEAFTASESGVYHASDKLNLNKLFQYVTDISDTSLKDVVKVKNRYGLLYLFMGAITQTEYDTYNPDSANIPVRLLYKAITFANQIDKLKVEFDDSLEKLRKRLVGNASI